METESSTKLKEVNKRSAVDWPAVESKKLCSSDHLNVPKSDKMESESSSGSCLTLESICTMELKTSTTNNCPTLDCTNIPVTDNPNFLNKTETNLDLSETTCFQESVNDIMEYISEEVVKVNEFSTLDDKQKDTVLKNISNLVHTRCKLIIGNKVIDGYTNVTNILYYENFIKNNKLIDDQILKIITEIPNHEDESIDVKVLPQAEQINKIFGDKIDQSVEKCFKKMITNIKDYEYENDIFQCLDELPNIENEDGESDKADKSEDNTIGTNIEGHNDVNKGKSHNKDNDELITGLHKDQDDYEPERKKLKEYYKIIDQLLAPKIHNLLERYKGEFQEILKNDKEYVEEEAKVTLKLRDEVDKYLNSEDISEEIDSENCDSDEDMNPENEDMLYEDISSETGDINEVMNSENNSDRHIDTNRNEDEKEKERDKLIHQKSNATIKSDPVCRVQLISMPALPLKEEIQQFLNQFNTKSIKKHKTLKNLLVIDLNTKNDYINILKASGTQIGPNKLIIKSHETNDSDIKEKNENVGNNSNAMSDIVKDNKQKPNEEIDDKIRHVTDRNSDLRMDAVKEKPSDERDVNSEINHIVESNDEPSNVRTVKEKERDGVKVKQDIVRRDMTDIAPVSTSQVVDKNDSQFVAKLVGFPCLPEKETIANFINKYNPTAIKKHKKCSNTLLIVFNSKTNYENFLSMDGHCLNNSGLTIRKASIIEKRCKRPDVAKEQTVQEPDPETIDKTLDACIINNNINVANCRTTVPSTNNTTDEHNIMTIAETNVDIKVCEIKDVSKDKTSNEISNINVDIQVLEEQNKIDRISERLDHKISIKNVEFESNSDAEPNNTYTPLDSNNLKTEKMDTDEGIDTRLDIDCNIIKVKEEIKESELTDWTQKVVREENNVPSIKHIKMESNSSPKTNIDNLETEEINSDDGVESKLDIGCNVIKVKGELKKELAVDNLETEEINSDDGIESGLDIDCNKIKVKEELFKKELAVSTDNGVEKENNSLSNNLETEEIESDDCIESELDNDCNELDNDCRLINVKEVVIDLTDNDVEEENNVLSNNLETIVIDSDDGMESQLDIDYKVVNVKEEIKEELADWTDNVVLEENDLQASLDDLKTEIKEENTVEFENNEEFYPSICDNSSDTEEISEYDLKEYFSENVKEILCKTITQTFAKIDKMNKESNFKLLNCKELVPTTEANITSNYETRKIEEVFRKKFSLIRDAVIPVLDQDVEYVHCKSIIIKNTKSLQQKVKEEK